MQNFISMQAKNIIFDLGGVLLRIDYSLTEKAFIDLGCKDFHAIYSQAKQTSLFDDFEKGKISENRFFEELKAISGLKTVNENQLKKAWQSMLIDFPVENLALLQNLKIKYRVFLLSNTNETHIQGFTSIIEKVCGFSSFEEQFEKVYYSSRLGLRKPDAECFNFVLQENNLIANETIFIDDSIQHIEGAAKTGIQAHWLEKPMQTKKLLEDLKLI